MGVGEGEGDTEEEHGKMYTNICRIDSSGNFLYDSGNSNQGSVTNQRSGMGWEVNGRSKREGPYIYLWLIHLDVWQKVKRNTLFQEHKRRLHMDITR